MLENGVCDAACLNRGCNSDINPKNNKDAPCSKTETMCNEDCYPYMIGDGVCDKPHCYTAACNWDVSDCDCAPGCTDALLNNDQCDDVCAG
jgi:hypothetical protein